MRGSYRELLATPGSPAFVVAGLVGRLPISMISLGIVLFVTDLHGSYALAGAMSAAFALAQAFVGPFGARLIDRFGQFPVGILLAAVQVLTLVAFVAAGQNGAPLPIQFGLLVVAGGVAPNAGSMVRARWAHLLRGRSLLGTAFALEAVVDEIVFIVGPPLAVWLTLQVGAGSALLASAGLIAVGLTWLSLQRRTQPQPSRRRTDVRSDRLLGAPMMVVLVIMAMLGGIFGSFEVTTVAFSRSLGAEGATGIALAVYALGSLIAGLLLGAVAPSWPAGRQLLAFSTLLAAVVLPIPLVGSLPVLIAAAFVAGVSVSPVLIATVSFVEISVEPERLTEALTLAISGVLVGLAAGSTLSGAIADSTRPASGYLVMSACGVLALATALVARGVLLKPAAADRS